jgi:hypothetical protein
VPRYHFFRKGEGGVHVTDGPALVLRPATSVAVERIGA